MAFENSRTIQILSKDMSTAGCGDQATKGSGYAVSAGHDLAAGIAADVIEDGGNAIDAGVAASIALTVLHSEQVQLGGVAPMLVHMARDKRTYAIEGAGRWPQASDRAHFETEHRGRIPQGILRTVVPAAPDAWITALSRFGTKGFAELAEPAMLLARTGFPAHEDLVSCTAQFERYYRRNDENARIWLPDDTPVKLGQTFVQSDLADTLGAMIDADRKAAASDGRLAGLSAVRDLFYKGDIAASMIRHVQAHDGWLAAADLATHRTPVVQATSAQVFGGTIFTCGPWSQGPALSQALQILEQFSLGQYDLKRLPAATSLARHAVLEALKLALADREAFYGDPDFVEPPMEQLLAHSYAQQRSGLIRADQAFDGLPPAGEVSGCNGITLPQVPGDDVDNATVDTSVAAVIDGEGNVFAATPSDPSFDGPVVPGLGFVISTRGAQSYVTPDHPARVHPGKRPRVSACPILFEAWDGRRIAGGGPGADLQLQAMAQVLVGHLVHGLPLDTAIKEPRCFTSSAPASSEPHLFYAGQVSVEEAVPDQIYDELSRLGHKTVRGAASGIARPSVCMVAAAAGGATYEAFGDPRRASGQRVRQSVGGGASS